jgi:hypothetical protein
MNQFFEKKTNKYPHVLILGAFIIFFSNSVMGQNIENRDTIQKVTTTGLFDGLIVNKYGYKINEFYIETWDLTDSQINTIKGKKVKVSGELYIQENNNQNGFQSSKDEKKNIKNPMIFLLQE